MKIIYKQGDLLECKEQVIVHGCNAQGVMGSGVALAIRKKYPDAARAYFNMKDKGRMQLGCCTYCPQEDGRTIVNAITQQFYGRNPHVIYVSYGAISHVFMNLNSWAKINSIKAVAIPKIGAGLANGDWSIIEKIIEAECTNVQVVCYVL
jgi:O-acetyl-ADP-ribose deacetylase (regulator of RNase III)